MDNKLITIITSLTLLLTAKAVIASTVIKVRDGDTIQVKQGEKEITVQLACLDAPEMEQRPWGKIAQQRLKQLLPTGKSISVRVVGKDQYGRTLAEIFSGNQSINLKMVREGQAVVYRQYQNGCAATKDKYLQAEAQAKASHLGFWNQSNPVMPWEFKQDKSRTISN